MGCAHSWKHIGECKICTKCGIRKLPDGEYFFDNEITNLEPEKKKKVVKKRNGEN